MELTKAKSKKCSLIVWGHRKKTGETASGMLDWLKSNYPDIFKMKYNCGYCERYGAIGRNYMCVKKPTCPLYVLWGHTCYNWSSLYHKWIKARFPRTRKKYATIMYNDIERS